MATTVDGVEDKGATPAITSVYENPRHTKKHFRQFRRPNGRRVHIAETPEEHARLKKEQQPLEGFDIYLHGTAEHVHIPPRPQADSC